MLKKSLVIGILAAFAMAPVAFAGEQVQGDTGNTNINANNVGRNNKIRVINKTYVIRSQRRAKKLLCQAPSNQTQANVGDTNINAINQGNRNRIKITNINNVVQGQSVDCSTR
ncbi:hypothetical protein NIES4071_01140 [Calothrix sp. NIES-4071]|nr:hypothetical protein NIES4071_01140 [Calothrix sp. NIES-4071]BAZ54460.1 hypothetical protein NIES4105_01130 [Calothrix sp. NIES-4105]